MATAVCVISGTYAAGAGRGRMHIPGILTAGTLDASEIIPFSIHSVLTLPVKRMREIWCFKFTNLISWKKQVENMAGELLDY